MSGISPGTAALEVEPLLSLSQVTKRFGNFAALTEVTLDLRAGEVHCILGENGAGKSTLCNLIFGVHRLDGGVMRYRGAPFRPSGPADALAHGIAMVHQHFSLVSDMSVVDNVLLLLTGDYSFPVHIGLPLTLVLAIILFVVLSRTIVGFRLRIVGLNPVAARRAGISYTRTVVFALSAAGAFGGLAGALMLLGEQYTLKDGFSSGYGFDGLVAGLLSRGSIPGVIAASLLFGFMRSGGINMEMVAAVPTALVAVIQGLIVVTLAGAALLIDKWGRP
jgi:hypothetical protein